MKTEKNEMKFDAQGASLQSTSPLVCGKGTVPGQQIGLYSKADNNEVRQVVKILNPDRNNMESRG